MFAPSPALLPVAGGVPRRAEAAPSDTSQRASGKKRPRVAPTRDSSACLTKMPRNRNSVVTAAGMEVLTVGGKKSSQELLQKRLASELDALRGLLKKAELISQRGACNGGAPTTGKKDRFLASNQRAKPIEKDCNAPSAKKRKISTMVEQKQIPAPRISPEERNQLVCRLSSLPGELPGHIVEFLQKHFGDADAHGEIEINIDSVKDSVLFELKTRLDKLAQERLIVVDVLPEVNDEKLAEESKSQGVLVKPEEDNAHISGVSTIVQTGSNSDRKSGSDDFPALREALPEQIVVTSAQPPTEPASGTAKSGEAKKVQDVQRAALPNTLSMASLINRAKVRRELMEMEKAKVRQELMEMERAKVRRELMEMEMAALPDERIHPRDLQRLGISEYGHPSLMRELGLVLKADAEA